MTALRHCRVHPEYRDFCHDCYALTYGRWAKCDCWTSGNDDKPKQHGADAHAKDCAIHTDWKVRASDDYFGCQ